MRGTIRLSINQIEFKLNIYNAIRLRVPLLIKGVSCKFIINGIDGPNTSASNNPTSLLGATHFRAVAKFTV